MKTLWQRFEDKFWPLRSTLSWKVTASVFTGILVIEAIILIPSYEQRRNVLTEDLHITAHNLVVGAFSGQSFRTKKELYARARGLMRTENIHGVAIYNSQGEKLTALGELTLLPDKLQKVEKRYEDKHRHEFKNHIDHEVSLAGGTTIIIRQEAGHIEADLNAYVWRVSGLVAIIAFFITFVTMVSVGYWVLSPLSRLRNSIIKVGNHRERIHIGIKELCRRDELGELARAMDSMVREISISMQEIETLARLPAESPAPVLRATPTGTVLYANNSASKQQSLFADENRAVVSRILRPVIEEAIEKKAPRKVDMPVGNKVYAFKVSPVPKAHYVNIFGQDVTKEKHNQARLEALNKRLERLLEKSRNSSSERVNLVETQTHFHTRNTG